MAGAAEQVAKAVVLEAMRTARQAGRGCVVYAFGGPGEVQRTVLDQDVDGLVALAGLLSASFHGGTDIAEPIEAAMADLGEAQWAGADLLIVSDGEFGVTADVLAEIAIARAHQQLRVQGILIGDRETLGLRELCDSIFCTWRLAGARQRAHPAVLSGGLDAGAALSLMRAGGRPKRRSREIHCSHAITDVSLPFGAKGMRGRLACRSFSTRC
jgi:uncharacterized protein with von Willebrand factor type A (vWA) domain